MRCACTCACVCVGMQETTLTVHEWGFERILTFEQGVGQNNYITTPLRYGYFSYISDICSSACFHAKIQSNLIISNSHISNYRLSRSENLVPVLTWNYDNRFFRKEEKMLLTSGVKLHIHLLNVVVQFIVFLTLSTLICRGTDISKYFSKSLGIRNNESRL